MQLPRKKVYICSSLRPEVYERVSRILAKMPDVIPLRPWGAQAGEKEGHVETDIAMIKYSDELYVLGEFGRDCSFEIGYALGISKPVVIYRDKTNAKFLEQDWMIVHGITTGLLKIIDLPFEDI